MPRPKKPDPAHAKTDEMLAGLERRIAEEYAQAAKDMASKYEKYMRKFEAGIAKQKSLLDAGEITKKEYTDWVYRHTLMTDRWKEMRDVLAKDLENSRDIARKMAGEQVADVYALNHNYAVYDIEHSAKIDTGLTLYNHDTAEYLLGDPRELMPGPSTRRAAEIARNKAMQWDKQKIQSAVLQGVLQGETSAQVAKRLQGVAEMGYNAAVRYARTMTTSAQNAGRYQAYHRAKKLGVELVIEWVAVLDSHTRHAHRMMHGQRRDVDEPFIITEDSGATFEIMYPADCSGLSDAPQSQIWNCRCTLKPMVKGFERETVKSSPGMGDMSFEEWQEAYADYERRGGGSEDHTFTPFDTDKVNVLTKTDYSKKTLDEMASLSGISALNPNDVDSVRIGKKSVTVSGDGIDIRVQIDKEENALLLDYMELEHKGQGTGAKVLDSMVKASRAHGLEKIILDASGSYGSSQNGYYTWPRLGFDASLTSAQKEKAKNAGFVAETISDLMKTEKGRKYWKENGTSIQEAVFDLSKNSKSMLTLEEYLKKKRK